MRRSDLQRVSPTSPRPSPPTISYPSGAERESELWPSACLGMRSIRPAHPPRHARTCSGHLPPVMPLEGWAALWMVGYPEPVRAGPAMTWQGAPRAFGGLFRTAAGPGRDASDTFSGRDSPGLSGINWDSRDSEGFHGSTGADVTGGRGRKRNPTTASSMRSTVSGERPLPGRCLARRLPRAGRGLGFLGRRLLPREAELVGAFDALENERETGELFRRRGLLSHTELGEGGERHRPQGLDQDEPRPAFGTLAERAHPTSRWHGRPPAVGGSGRAWSWYSGRRPSGSTRRPRPG